MGRAFWEAHVEAWRRSGETQAAYCPYGRVGLEDRCLCSGSHGRLTIGASRHQWRASELRGGEACRK